MSDQDSREKRDSESSPSNEVSEQDQETVSPESRDETEDGVARPESSPDGAETEADRAEDSPKESEKDSEGEEPAGGTPSDDAEQAATALSSKTYYDDPYAEYEYEYQDPDSSSKEETTALTETKPDSERAAPPPPPPPTDGEDEFDDDEDGMVRMSFLEHLEELRIRILHSLAGLVVAYVFCLLFANRLFQAMRQPFDRAVEGLEGVRLIQITTVETFQLVWIKVPLVTAVFVAAPWLTYQVWAFIAPGLYKRERRWAKPFIFCTAGLFILGGLFGYFIVLQFALAFLLGLGQELGIDATITITSYFNTFVSIMLGLGVVFQMPVLIFFLTLLRIVNPAMLLNNVRYAVLIIFVVAAVITPTPDVFNMILFAAPMILLYYVGIGASYLLVLKREQRKAPWLKIFTIAITVIAVIAAVLYYMHAELGYQFVPEAPWFVRPEQ